MRAPTTSKERRRSQTNPGGNSGDDGSHCSSNLWRDLDGSEAHAEHENGRDSSGNSNSGCLLHSNPLLRGGLTKASRPIVKFRVFPLEAEEGQNMEPGMGHVG